MGSRRYRKPRPQALPWHAGLAHNPHRTTSHPGKRI